MKKRFARFNFKRMTNSGFIDAARGIQTALSDTMFSAVQPAPSEVLPLILEMQSLLNQTNLGNNMLKPRRDQVRATITELLYQQSSSVNFIANGDMTVLVRSGFTISKERERMPEPTKGSTPIVLEIKAGEALLTSNGIKHHDYYEMEVNGADGFSKTYACKKKKIKADRLPEGVVLKARIRGINGRGQGPWSDSVIFMVYGNAQRSANSD